MTGEKRPKSGPPISAKSPILPVPDSLLIRTRVGVGTTDTLVVDISTVVTLWQSFPDQVRSVVIRALFEAAAVGELRFGSTRTLGFEPALRVTYVPAFSFGQR